LAVDRIKKKHNQRYGLIEFKSQQFARSS